MATSKELLKAQANGAEVRVDAVNGGGLVEYRPRSKGDRLAWVLPASRATNWNEYRYTAAKCVAVVPAPVAAPEEIKEEETVINSNITPEVIEALRTLRNTNLNHYGPLWGAVNVLDNAGIFAAIDEATDYDTDPAPEKISRCTCPGGTWGGQEHLTGCPAEQISRCTCPTGRNKPLSGHLTGCPDYPAPERVSRCTCPAQDHGGKHAPACPGDPAEWGDMAFGPIHTAVNNIRNAVGLKF